MKKKQQLPLPLQLVKEYGEKYPEAYKFVENLRSQNDLIWNKNKCYIPIAATLAIANECGAEKTDQNAATKIAAFSAWRIFKEIYHFDREFAQVLYEQANDMEEIPVEALNSLPYPCIYIELEDDTFQGFFTFWEQNYTENGATEEYELRFLTIGNPDGGFGIYHLHIVGGHTLKESAVQTTKRMKFGLTATGKEFDSEYIDLVCDMQTEVVSRLLQLVLYICAKNADIEENPVQKQITRKTSAGNQPKDVFREIRKWDVGVKIGNVIRKAQTEQSEKITTVSGRNAPRPHTRRGHWHHYWIGSEKDGTRKLILKWTAPTFVGGTGEDIITTINNVGEEN